MAATPQQLSDWEGLMWRLESDPFLSANIGNVSVLDRPLDTAALRRRLEWAIVAIPRLRQRIRPLPFNLDAPAWVDDTAFDLDRHLRRVTLPAPSDERALIDVATRLTAEPFEGDHPLWQLFVVDGLDGGRGALIQKFHHVLADGEGAMIMALSFIDAARHVTERDAPRPEEIPELVPPPPVPPLRRLVTDLAAKSLEWPKAALREASISLRQPSRLLTNSAKVVETTAAVLSQLVEGGPAFSPLWTARSNKRRVEVLSVPFAPIREAANRLGGTVNVAFLTVAAAAAGDYHRELGAPIDHLRAAMAISTRTSHEPANAFTLARFTVPTASMSTAERFRRVAGVTAHARRSATAATLDQLARLAIGVPTPVLNFVARQQASSVDFATSNVRFSPMPVYIAGAEIVRSYPIGPLVGVAFNLTLISYAGNLDMGMHIDTAAVRDPARLREKLAERLDEFATLASTH